MNMNMRRDRQNYNQAHGSTPAFAFQETAGTKSVPVIKQGDDYDYSS